MRTYTGNAVDESLALEDGFTGTISENAFEIDGALLAAWRKDMAKYYPGEIEALEAAKAAAEPVVEVAAEPEVELTAEAVEAAVTEPIVEPVVEPVVIEGGAEMEKPKYIPSPTFCEKMLKASEILQDRYDELKNYALRFKKLKSRLSKKFDSINQGRLQFVKLSVAGKTLKLFLNMDIADTDPKFHCKDMRDKKTYVTVPVQLRIKSGRAVRYAKILIDQCAGIHGLKENPKFEEVDAIGLVEEFMRRGEEADEAAATEA